MTLTIFWITVHRDVSYPLVRSACSADVFFFLILSLLEQTSPYQSYLEPLASVSYTPASTTSTAHHSPTHATYHHGAKEDVALDPEWKSEMLLESSASVRCAACCRDRTWLASRMASGTCFLFVLYHEGSQPRGCAWKHLGNFLSTVTCPRALPNQKSGLINQEAAWLSEFSYVLGCLCSKSWRAHRPS